MPRPGRARDAACCGCGTAATSPSHAELITWTFDRPADAVTAGDAYHTYTITSAQEALVSNDCSTAAINASDLDTSISTCTGRSASSC